MLLRGIRNLWLKEMRSAGWYFFIVIVFIFIVFGTRNALALDDGLRHMVVASQYRNLGLATAPGLSAFFFTGYFATHAVDPWFLSHVAYMPFTLAGNDLLGLKLATLASLIVLLVSIALVLRELALPRGLAFLFLPVLFFGSEDFMQRLLIGRPFVLMTAIFLLAYFCILRRRFFMLAPLLAVAVLLSHLFFFPLILCAIAAGVFAVVRQPRPAIRCAGWSCAGTAAGLLLHPQPAAYVSYLYTIFVKSVVLQQQVGGPAEMQSGLFGSDVSISLGLLSIILLGHLCASYGIWKKDQLRQRPDILLSLALFGGLMLMYFLWLRTIDFLWPILVILAMQLATLTPQISEDVQRYLQSPVFRRVKWQHVLLFVCALNVLDVGIYYFGTDRTRDQSGYSAISLVPRGSRVLNIDWALLPPLLVSNRSVKYARGIDPVLDTYSDPDGQVLSEYLLSRWRWQWSDIRGSLNGLYQRYRFPWSFVVVGERQGVDFPAWIGRLQQHYHADFLVIDNSMHPQAGTEIRKVLPVFAESKAITVFTFPPQKQLERAR